MKHQKMTVGYQIWSNITARALMKTTDLWPLVCDLCVSRPQLIARVKETKMQNVLLMKCQAACLLTLDLGGSNPGQCQSVCVHSLCCGSFQITETWCGSLFPSDSQLLPFLLHGKTGGGGGISRDGGGYDGTKSALLLLLSAATNDQTTNPGLPCTQLCSVGLSVCFVSSMIHPEKLLVQHKWTFHIF